MGKAKPTHEYKFKVGDHVHVERKVEWPHWVSSMDGMVGGTYQIILSQLDYAKNGSYFLGRWWFPEAALRLAEPTEQLTEQPREQEDYSMSTSITYDKGQKTCGIEDGDMVRVTRKLEKSGEKGWEISWMPAMDEAVGRIFQVSKVAYERGILLKGSNPKPDKGDFYFPYFVLEKVELPAGARLVDPSPYYCSEHGLVNLYAMSGPTKNTHYHLSCGCEYEDDGEGHIARVE